jgi:hypothetical protein
MGLDKLNLTIYEPPDSELLKEIGFVSEDIYRNRFYRYFCNLDHTQVMWKPHKFGPELNERMAYTKLDCSPKHFSCFQELIDNLQNYFSAPNPISLDRFMISRVDVKADIENLPLDVVQARLFVKGLRKDSLSIYKGTIYMGVDPKIKIYDKTKEIKARQRKKVELTEWEEEVLKDKKEITRIEVAIKRPGLTLEELVRKPESLVSYLERLEFFNLEDDQNISAVGGLQMIMRNTRREFRNALKEFTDKRIRELIREDYLEGVKTWFSNKSKTINDDVPF